MFFEKINRTKENRSYFLIELFLKAITLELSIELFLP